VEVIPLLETNWEKELEVFRKNLQLLLVKPDKEAVHDLRVAVKKMRAILELYLFISDERFLKNPIQETETLFSILGKQRDTEICIDILASYKKETRLKFPLFSEFLDAILKKTYQWTDKASKTYAIKELNSIKILFKNGENKPNEIFDTDLMLNVISSQLKKSSSFYKQPHKLRQHLKRIYYWVKLLPESLAEKIHEKELHALCDMLGEWQDLEIFGTRIRHFRKDILPGCYDESKDIKVVQADIKEKNAKKLSAALAKCRRLIKMTKTAEKTPG
jgi:CHAD domain-containing protein